MSKNSRDKTQCPDCHQYVTPRIVFKNGDAQKGICPLCGAVIWDKSGCFVTTAVCEILGKDDNCYELETLRNFRDNELLSDDNLKELVYKYYAMSPKLISIIEKQSNKKEFSQFIFSRHIELIVKQIDNNNFTEAISLYKKMIEIIKVS